MQKIYKFIVVLPWVGIDSIKEDKIHHSLNAMITYIIVMPNNMVSKPQYAPNFLMLD